MRELKKRKEKKVVYEYDRILFSNEKEQNTDTCSSGSWSQSYYVKLKPDAKDHMVDGSIHRKCPEKANP